MADDPLFTAHDEGARDVWRRPVSSWARPGSTMSSWCSTSRWSWASVCGRADRCRRASTSCCPAARSRLDHRPGVRLGQPRRDRAHRHDGQRRAVRPPTVHYYWIGAVPAMVFLGIVMMPFYYGSKVRSVPEFLQKRFNHATQRVNAVTFALPRCSSRASTCSRSALVLEALLGWSLRLAIAVAALVVLSYTFLGGLSAAIYNEVLQFFVILALLDPADRRRACAQVGGWDGLIEKITRSGQRGRAARLAGHPATGIDNPFGPTARHRVRARLRAVLRLLDHELRRGPARPVGQEHVAARRTPIIAAYPKAVHPAGHRDPRHDRRGAGAALTAARRAADRRHVQQRALVADERGAAQRRAGRRAGGSAGRVHGGHGGQRQLAQHGVHLRHLAGLAASGKDDRLLPAGRPGRHGDRVRAGDRHGRASRAATRT